MSVDLALASETSAQFTLKGGFFASTVMQLHGVHLSSLAKQLSQKIAQAPKFFNNAPIILDMQKLKHNVNALDFLHLKQILSEHAMIAVGIKGLPPELHNRALLAGFALLPEQAQKKQGIESVSTQSNESRIIKEPIRSGQQISSLGDLTIIGPVGHGAELVAEGSIHVYGPLRGKALAGKSNNSNARIFCTSLEAELISIAGHYKIADDIDSKFWRASVTIALEKSKLVFEFI